MIIIRHQEIRFWSRSIWLVELVTFYVYLFTKPMKRI